MGKVMFRRGADEIRVDSQGVCEGLFVDGVYDRVRNIMILKGGTEYPYEGHLIEEIEGMLRKEGFEKAV